MENAMRLAAVDLLPEALPNSVVGWAGTAPRRARDLADIPYDGGLPPDRMRRASTDRTGLGHPFPMGRRP